MIVDFIDNVLTISDGKTTFLIQPTWPDNTPWKNEDEARKWADLLIKHMLDVSVPAPPGKPEYLN